MVQITFNTKDDTTEDLEQALAVLQDAIARRKGTTHHAPAAQHTPAAHTPAVETTEIETPFLKISFSNDEPAAPAHTSPAPQQATTPQTPSLNQLIHDDSLTEAELSKMFRQVQADEPPAKPAKKTSSEASFIEIVEFDEPDEK